MKSQIFILNLCFCSNTIDYNAPCGQWWYCNAWSRYFGTQMLFWIDDGV